MAGFFKIPHDLYRGLSRDPNTFRVYCELASRARWTAGTCLGSHGVVELSAGQCVLGRAGLARDLGLTERAVRTSLERLSAVGAVTIEATKRGTIVTVHEDWESAESRPTERPSVATQNDQAPAPQTANRTTTNEEERKKKEETYTHARERHPKAGAVARGTWDHGAKVAADLRAAGVPVPPWSLMVDGDHPAWKALLDRACELLVENSATEAEQICRNRVDVAAAMAMSSPAEARWFASTAMFTRSSFEAFAYLSPEQFTRKAARHAPDDALATAMRIAQEKA